MIVGVRAGTWDLEGGITKVHKSAVIPARNHFSSPFVASKYYHPLVLLPCSRSWGCVDDGEHLLKATAILHLANSDRCATPCVFRDLCRSYSVLVLEINLSSSHRQSQNLLRLFISVLFLSLEDFTWSRIFPVRTSASCCLSSAVGSLSLTKPS